MKKFLKLLFTLFIAQASISMHGQNIIMQADAVIIGKDTFPKASNQVRDTILFFDKANGRFYSGFLGTDGIETLQIDSMGVGSIGLGFDVFPMGILSSSIGFGNISRADFSTTIGTSLVNNIPNSMVVGNRNDPIFTNKQLSLTNDSPMFTVGNGGAFFSSNHNALTSYYDGRLEINQSYILPNQDGNINQSLITDGNGIVSWENNLFVDDAGLIRLTGNSSLSGNKDFIIGDIELPTEGTSFERLLFFDESKGAIRVGRVASANWNVDSLGINSFATGEDTKAMGSESAAFGEDTEALGSQSTSFGRNTKASASRSTAFGFNTESSGSNATAFGEDTEASGTNSTAFGDGSVASGIGASSFGDETNAIGRYSLSSGYRTNAEAYADFVIGRYNSGGGNGSFWSVNDPVFEIGIGGSDVSRENAITVLKNGTVSFKEYTFPNIDGSDDQILSTDGNGNLTWGDKGSVGVFEDDGSTIQPIGNNVRDFLFGTNAIPPNGVTTNDRMIIFDDTKGAFRAGGVGSDAWATDSIGSYSTAFGLNNFATGVYSTALGNRTKARGTRSLSTGYFSEANGNYSFSAGNRSLANGESAAAFNIETDANAYASSAFGRFNVGLGAAGAWNPEDPIFEIGNGLDASNKSNALTVTKDGDVLFERHQAPLPGVVENGGGFFYHAAKNSLRIGNLPNLATTSDSLGLNSMGFGNLPIAKGAGSVAIGDQNTATWLGSFAGGKQSESHATGSVALGYHTLTKSYGSASLGSYNIGLGTDKNFWEPTDPILEVGIGESNATRENALTILKNGNVGIGTHTPEVDLDVNGQGQISTNSGSLTPHLRLEEDGNDYARLTFTNKTINTANYWTVAGRIETVNADSRLNFFYKDYGDVLKLYGDGRVFIPHRLGIGDVTPDAAFDIHSAANEDPLHVHVGNEDKMRIYNNGSIALGGLYSGTPNDVFIVNQLGMGIASPVYRIDIQNSTTASLGKARANEWLSLSDARIKKNVEPIDYGLKDILKLRPVKYNHHSSQFKEKTLEIMDEHSPEIGFLAQEVYQVIHEIVEKPQDESQDLWSMNYEKLTPVLVKAIQELNDDKLDMQDKLEAQQKMIDQLLNVTESLTSQVNELKTSINN